MLNKLINKASPELRLMLASAISDLNKTKYFLQQPINWDKFLYLANHHQVYPSVYRVLGHLNDLLVPEYVLDVLRLACQENTLSAMRITGEMVRIGNLLENNDISSVVLKGPPLSRRLYGDIAARPYSDVDILVASDKLDQTIAILENESYCRISKFDSYNLTPRQLQIYLKHHEHSSHFEYWNSKKRVLIEIHWKLSKYGNVLPFPTDRSIEKMVVAGNLQPVLSDEEWFLYLVLHGSGHKWHRLRWLIDINKFIQQENINWLNMGRLAEKYGIKSFLYQSLILVSQVFGVALPHELEPDIVRDKTAWRIAYLALQSCILAAGDQFRREGICSLFLNNYYGLYMNRGWQNKFSYVLKVLGPTVEDIKLVALPGRLYALYYVIGPFTFSARNLRRLMMRNKHVNTKNVFDKLKEFK